MRITFHINYGTQWGEKLFVCGNIAELGNWQEGQAAVMKHMGQEHWELTIEIAERDFQSLEYKYFVKSDHSSAQWESGKNRQMQFSVYPNMQIWDYWRPANVARNVMDSAAFTKAIMKRQDKFDGSELRITGSEAVVIFRLHAPSISPKHVFGIIGSDMGLGKWDEKNVVLMQDYKYPMFEATVGIKKTNADIYYKYVIYDIEQKKIVAWEQGENRRLFLNLKNATQITLFVQSDEDFRYTHAWKGAGVAIPVFSLRSSQGNGVGEFTDLPLLTDWAKKTGLKMVQILPINDTVATHTWTDSYPYAAISVFALHPMYVNLQAMGTLKDAEQQAMFDAQREKLNQLPAIDYEAVMKMKSRFFKLLFDQEKETLLQDADFQQFVEENAHWLKPYAVFSHLRDLYNTPDFSQWKIASTFNWEEIQEMCSPEDEHFEHIAIHYFIQYHADRQLLAATAYARSNGITLKGDIPIGIYRYSVDAWMNPHLYNMNGQAGAPPDAFAVKGQNWGFPTYNWAEMAKDGYAWWKQRMTQLSRYFDAYRIDHILGFFRIWEVPYAQTEGLMGKFNPELPITWDEIKAAGVNLDYDRMCKPYIRAHFLDALFGAHTSEVKQLCLDDIGYGLYTLKRHVDTQRAAEAWVAEQKWDDAKSNVIKEGLNNLISEVLFFDSGYGKLTPRISITSTRSFQELDADQQWRIEQLYTQYFFHRMNDFWRDRAMEKLPALVNATDMLICGEDLGMIPSCVDGVMKELNILSLEIQRMPKGNVLFGHPNDAPYLSVVTPSSHDMSTVRGWWEEDRTLTQKFYNQILQNEGDAPFYCEPWICKQIVEQHMYSPAMWVVFPIQDLLALDGKLRRENPHDEQINVPANPKHYWRYRFHLNLESLMQADSLNQTIAGIVESSGR